MSWLVFAQEAVPSADGVGSLVATYGPFAPFAALLLWLLKLLWKDNKEKEDEIRNLTAAAMEKVIPLVLEATNVLSEAVEALQRVRENQHSTQQVAEMMEELLGAMETLQAAIRASAKRTAAQTKRASPRKKAT